MPNQRYTPEFKDEAVRQVTERGYRVADVATRIGVSTLLRLTLWPLSDHAIQDRRLLSLIESCYAASVGYRRPSIVIPNKLQRAFSVAQPDESWVTDITYIRTWLGRLYLAVVLDLFSRNVLAWSMPVPLN